jgi:hypothetical protein
MREGRRGGEATKPAMWPARPSCPLNGSSRSEACVSWVSFLSSLELSSSIDRECTHLLCVTQMHTHLLIHQACPHSRQGTRDTHFLPVRTGSGDRPVVQVWTLYTPLICWVGKSPHATPHGTSESAALSWSDDPALTMPAGFNGPHMSMDTTPQSRSTGRVTGPPQDGGHPRAGALVPSL